MTKQTLLNATHRAHGAKMVDFGGWDMPINYGSQIEEHHQVRRDAGMFDVSHMTVLDMHGEQVRPFLRKLIANSVDKLTKPGKALYSCMLDENGGVIDDLIVYFHERGLLPRGGQRRHPRQGHGLDRGAGRALRHRHPRAPRPGDGRGAGPERARARCIVAAVAGGAATRWQARQVRRAPRSDGMFVARTGYTGEDGFEIMVPEGAGRRLLEAPGRRRRQAGGPGRARHAAPGSGHGACTARTWTKAVSPFEAGLAWTVALDEGRDFIGRAALERQKAAGVPRQMIGLVLDEKGVLRHGQAVLHRGGRGRDPVGHVLADAGQGDRAGARAGRRHRRRSTVDIRGKRVPVRAVRYPFVRDGAAQPGV